MSDYCKQCSENIFGEDFGNFANIAGESEIAHVLCEGCGEVIPVDNNGKRADDNWLQPHTKEWQIRLGLNVSK